MIETTSNIYSKFSGANNTNNRDFLATIYGKKNIGQFDVSQNDNPKKNKKYIAILALSASAILGTLGMVLGYNKGNFSAKQFEKISKESIETAQGFLKKASNVMSNIVNIKDDLWAKFSNKTKKIQIGKILEKFNEITTDFNKNKLFKPSFKLTYDKAKDNLIKASNGKIRPQEYEKLFDSLDKEINSALHKPNERVTDNLLNKNIIQNLTQGNIADKKIENLNSVKSAIIKIPENANEKTQKAIHEYNQATNTMICKMRDLNCGSAPTDYLTMISATGALGVAALNADNKEERRSIILELGIPLITTLGFSFYASAKALSGATGLLAGVITGRIASFCAGVFVKNYDKFSNQKNA